MFKIFGLNAQYYVNEERHVRRVVFSSKGLCRFFKDNFGEIAPDKKMPQWLFGLSNEFKQLFIDGFCDGDGCKRKNGDYRLISSSKKLLLDIQSLSFSMNKFACIYNSRKKGKICKIGKGGKEYKTAGLWEVTISNRKQEKPQYREDDKYFYVPVKNIKEEEYFGDVINFETEGNGDDNHTYLVGNIISHNCDGDIWHQRDDFIQRDKIRDQKLANVGWRILRFREDAVEEHIDTIKDIVHSNLIEASRDLKKRSSDDTLKKYASADEFILGCDDVGVNIIPLPKNLGYLYLIGK